MVPESAEVIDLTLSDDEHEPRRSVHSPRRPPLFRSHHEDMFQRATAAAAGILPPDFRGGGSQSGQSGSRPPPDSSPYRFGSFFNAAGSFGSFMGLSSSSSGSANAHRTGPSRPPSLPEMTRLESPRGSSDFQSSSRQPSVSPFMPPTTAASIAQSAFSRQQQTLPRLSTNRSNQQDSHQAWFGRQQSPANIAAPSGVRSLASPPPIHQQDPPHQSAPPPLQHRALSGSQASAAAQSSNPHQPPEEPVVRPYFTLRQSPGRFAPRGAVPIEPRPEPRPEPFQRQPPRAHIQDQSLPRLFTPRRHPPPHAPSSQISRPKSPAGETFPGGRPSSINSSLPGNSPAQDPPSRGSRPPPLHLSQSPLTRQSPLGQAAANGVSAQSPPTIDLRQSATPRQSPLVRPLPDGQPSPQGQPSNQPAAQSAKPAGPDQSAPPRLPTLRRPSSPRVLPTRPGPSPRQSPLASSPSNQLSFMPSAPTLARPFRDSASGSTPVPLRPDSHPDSHSDSHADLRSGSHPGPHPGSRPGSRSGSHPASRPASRSGPSPASHPGSRPQSSSLSLSVLSSSPPTPIFSVDSREVEMQPTQNDASSNRNAHSPPAPPPTSIPAVAQPPLPTSAPLSKPQPASPVRPVSPAPPASPARLAPSAIPATPPQPASPASLEFPTSMVLDTAQEKPQPLTPKSTKWTAENVEAALNGFLKNLHKDHARLVEYAIESQKPRHPRHLSSFDDFADMKSQSVDLSTETGEGLDLLKVRIKHHRDNQRRVEGRVLHVKTISLKSPNEKVPKYRFHHVEIAKNILTPNTPLKFIPHIRDLDDGSEDKKKFDQWIEELESMELKSGFDTSKRFDKWASTRATEFARLVFVYLDGWMASLGIDSDTKAAMIRYMASETQNEKTMTPQQKRSLLTSCGESPETPRATMVARVFTDAFNRVFMKKHITLYDVLRQDEAVESVFDPKKAARDAAAAAAAAASAAAAAASQADAETESIVDQVQQYLGTYSALGCLICHAHSCEHGEFDAENIRRCFSIEDLGGKLWMHVERRREQQARARHQRAALQQKPASSSNSAALANNTDSSSTAAPAAPPCDNQCYRSYDIGDPAFVKREWTANETSLLKSLYFTLGDSTVRVQCTVAAILGRFCWEVYRRAKELGLHLPRPVEPIGDAPIVKSVTWYDRHRKVLNGDWQDHTYTHIHALREQREPCNHEGPCTAARGCPCAEAKLLCERFCRCTSETCAYKFTGCACHGSGKTCYQRQKEGKPCICVQLNRECDPVLCGGCGASERADPCNRDDEALHATGCQNVALQRGKAKTVLLGKSQLEGCGYGLFTAEDISADEFIIEYIGELITHDEGVRREARRGDVFNQESNASYLFTLLEQDGIWVDAAIYGNLSRYINHASESDKRGCNIMPKILYVNGEFRIRFTAMRDIKAGEELFFNYGENFPNLTKKLLEDKASTSDLDEADANGQLNNGSAADGHGPATRRRTRRTRRKGGRPANAAGSSAAQKRSMSIKRAKTKGARKEAPPTHTTAADAADSVDGDMDVDDDSSLPVSRPRRGTKRKRRHHYNDDEDDDDDDGDDDDDDGGGGGHDGVRHESSSRASHWHGKGALRHDSDDEFVGAPALRRARAARRRIGTTTVSESGASNPMTTRSRDPEMHPDLQLHHDADEDDANADERLRNGAMRHKTTAAAATASNGDLPPLRKRLRTTATTTTTATATATATATGSAAASTADGDTVADSDSPSVASHRARRAARQTRLAERAEASVGTDDDQGSVMSAGQFYGRRGASSASAGAGAGAGANTSASVGANGTNSANGVNGANGANTTNSANGATGTPNGTAANGTHVVPDSDEEDEDEDGMDRSQRRRQKPARYRVGDA